MFIYIECICFFFFYILRRQVVRHIDWCNQDKKELLFIILSSAPLVTSFTHFHSRFYFALLCSVLFRLFILNVGGAYVRVRELICFIGRFYCKRMQCNQFYIFFSWLEGSLRWYISLLEWFLIQWCIWREVHIIFFYLYVNLWSLWCSFYTSPLP